MLIKPKRPLARRRRHDILNLVVVVVRYIETVPHLIRFKCEIQNHSRPGLYWPVAMGGGGVGMMLCTVPASPLTIFADFLRLTCVNMSVRLGVGEVGRSLAVRFKLLLVVGLHHIILDATATDIVVLRIGDNKICCTATRLTLATVTGKRICIVAAFFFMCALFFATRTGASGMGWFIEKSLRKQCTRRTACRFVGASEWCLNWSLL